MKRRIVHDVADLARAEKEVWCVGTKDACKQTTDALKLNRVRETIKQLQVLTLHSIEEHRTFKKHRRNRCENALICHDRKNFEKHEIQQSVHNIQCHCATYPLILTLLKKNLQ